MRRTASVATWTATRLVLEQCRARRRLQRRHRLDAPRRKLLGRIRLPEVCGNLCFGGPKRNRLFMVASQSLRMLVRRRHRMSPIAPLLALLALVAQLPSGEIVPDVKCEADATMSYALYLPRGYAGPRVSGHLRLRPRRTAGFRSNAIRPRRAVRLHRRGVEQLERFAHHRAGGQRHDHRRDGAVSTWIRSASTSPACRAAPAWHSPWRCRTGRRSPASSRRARDTPTPNLERACRSRSPERPAPMISTTSKCGGWTRR